LNSPQIVAPKVPCVGYGVGRGCFSPHSRMAWRENFLISYPKIASFSAFLSVIFKVRLPVLHAKADVLYGLRKLAVACMARTNCANTANLISLELVLAVWYQTCRCTTASQTCKTCRRAVSVRPSVLPFVMFVYKTYAEMNKHIFKRFSPSGSHTILGFPYQTLWQYFDGNSPNGGFEYRSGRQKSQFSANIWLSNRWLL